MMGKTGSMLGQAGRVMGIGSKTGRAMRAGGQLLNAGQGMMHAKDNLKGRRLGMFNAAATMLRDNPSQYRQFNPETGTYDPATDEAKQRAMKDAQKMAEKGSGFLRAGKSRDEFMRQWDAVYEGAEPKMPPQTGPDPKPKPKPKPRPDPEPLPPSGGDKQLTSGAGLAPGGDPTSFEGPSPEDSPTPSAGSAATAPTHGVSAGTAGAGRGPVRSYEEYAEKARENLGGPAFAKEMDYSVKTVRSSDDVLTNAGLSRDQVVQNPSVLLSGDAYNGGSTTSMDPFHAATPTLNELRFAGGSGDEDAIQKAVEKAADAISLHGVPNQVDGVHSIGDRASSFDPIALVGAMPDLRESMSWQERAEAAYTMQAAQVALPEGAPAVIRDGVHEFTDYLSRPSSGIQDLITLRDDAIADIDWGMRTNGQVWDATPPRVPEAMHTDPTQTPYVPEQEAAPSSHTETERGAPSSPPVDDDPVDAVDDSEALVYRPGRDRRKKMRSGFFDHDNDQSDDEEES